MKKFLEQFYRPNQVCEALNISKTTLWRYVKSGKLPQPIKLGNSRATAFSSIEIHDHIERCKQERDQ